MKSYTVEVSVDYNATIVVDADSPSEAISKARKELDEHGRDIPDEIRTTPATFLLGEVTADYASEIN